MPTMHAGSPSSKVEGRVSEWLKLIGWVVLISATDASDDIVSLSKPLLDPSTAVIVKEVFCFPS